MLPENWFCLRSRFFEARKKKMFVFKKSIVFPCEYLALSIVEETSCLCGSRICFGNDHSNSSVTRVQRGQDLGNIAIEDSPRTTRTERQRTCALARKVDLDQLGTRAFFGRESVLCWRSCSTSRLFATTKSAFSACLFVSGLPPCSQ